MVVDGNIVQWVLKLNKSLYGLKQESKYWFNPLKTGLDSRGFHQYHVDPCSFYIKDSSIKTYVYDCVIISQKQDTITQ